MADRPGVPGRQISVVDRLWRVALWIAYRLQFVYWFVFRPSEPSAHVAVWWQGRLLIVFSSYKRHVSMPAGGLKRREEPIEAACRELREEVGIAVEQGSLREAGLFVSRQQFKEDRAYVYEIEFEQAPDVMIDGREVVGFEFAEPVDVLQMRTSHVLRSYLTQRDQGRDVDA